MAKYHCRCRGCQARRVLPQEPSAYLTQPKCACGARNWRLDAWMNKRRTSPFRGGEGCQCAGYHFPHRQGSRFCWYRKDGEARVPGDPDFADRHLSPEEIAEAAKLQEK